MGTNFHDDGLHAFMVGALSGLILNDIANARQQGVKPLPNWTSVEVEADTDGDFKPILTVTMDSGRQFRIIVAEVT